MVVRLECVADGLTQFPQLPRLIMVRPFHSEIFAHIFPVVACRSGRSKKAATYHDYCLWSPSFLVSVFLSLRLYWVTHKALGCSLAQVSTRFCLS
jgi:hypothetical protein